LTESQRPPRPFVFHFKKLCQFHLVSHLRAHSSFIFSCFSWMSHLKPNKCNLLPFFAASFFPEQLLLMGKWKKKLRAKIDRNLILVASWISWHGRGFNGHDYTKHQSALLAQFRIHNQTGTSLKNKTATTKCSGVGQEMFEGKWIISTYIFRHCSEVFHVVFLKKKHWVTVAKILFLKCLLQEKF